MEPEPAEKRMRLRYAGTCRVCGIALPAKTEAIWDKTSKTVRCVTHDLGSTAQPEVTEVVEAGTAGASARREFERRRAKREDRIRTNHPRLGGLILALTEERRSTRAWDTGALGEERLGRHLSQLGSETLRLLHDRRIPRGRANIDHLAVTSTGVYVIDAKKYRGRPHLRVEGGLVRPRVERLMVGSRDCTRLVDGVVKQVEIVRGLMQHDVPVRGVLCFVEADWPLIGGAFSTRGVQALWPRKLCQGLQAEGPLAVDVIAEVHRELARALPAA